MVARRFQRFLDDRRRRQQEPLLLRLPAEGQNLTHKVPGPLGGVHDVSQILPNLIPFVHAAYRHLRIRQDRRKNIIEVVRDSARKRTDGFHLLGAPQLLFQQHALLICTLQFGNVVEDAETAKKLPRLVEARRGRYPDHPLLAVLAVYRQIIKRRLSPFALRTLTFQHASVLTRQEVPEAQPVQVVHSKDPVGGRI